MEGNKTIDDFEKIILGIVDGASKLKEYDYFGAMAIVSVVQLLMSKSSLFVKSMNDNDNSSQQQEQIQIPDAVIDEVDAIVSEIRTRLESE